MALKIVDSCISCGACEPECPNEAITCGDAIYEIEADKCTECYGFYGESQCISVCPVEAIVLDEDNPDTIDTLTEKFNKYHPGGSLKNTSSWKKPS